MVHDARECVLIVTGERGLEFEIATRRAIHDDRVFATFDRDRLQMWQRRLLSIVDVLQQGAGRGDTARKSVAAESGQVACAELGTEQARRAVEFEVPGWPPRNADIVAEAV